jgi:phage gpG-like protein
MMANAFSWHGDALKRKFEGMVGRRLDAASIVVQNHAKALISTEGTAKATAGRTLRSGRKVRKGSLIYGASPSKPGEPPNVQTGRLRGSVAHERVGMVARVGTNVRYGRDLELGTRKMAARPWLRRALVEMTPAVQAILAAPYDI